MKVPADSTSSESPTSGVHKAAFSGDLHTVQGGGRSLLFLLMRALVQSSQGSIFRRSLSLIASQRPHFNMKTITLESMASTHDFRGDTNILYFVHSQGSLCPGRARWAFPGREQHARRSWSVKWHGGCSPPWAVWCSQTLQTLPPPPHTESFLQTNRTWEPSR